MKIEINDEMREELTKNQIARLFTSEVTKHFLKNKTMNEDDYYKYMKIASNKMKKYMEDKT